MLSRLNLTSQYFCLSFSYRAFLRSYFLLPARLEIPYHPSFVPRYQDYPSLPARIFLLLYFRFLQAVLEAPALRAFALRHRTYPCLFARFAVYPQAVSVLRTICLRFHAR